MKKHMFTNLICSILTVCSMQSIILYANATYNEDLSLTNDNLSTLNNEDLSLTNDNLSTLNNENLSLTNDNLSTLNNEDLSLTNDTISTLNNEDLSLTNDTISTLNNEDLSLTNDTISTLNNEDTYLTTVDDIVYKIHTNTIYTVPTEIPPHAEVYKYEGSSPDITLPESVDGYPLLSINKAFKDNTNIVSVVLPPSIQFIDTGAFMGCTHLNEIVFTTSSEDYWVEIGPYAFKNCFNLKSVIGSENIKMFYTECFANCISLKDFTFGARVHAFNSAMFNNTGIENIYVKDSSESFKTYGKDIYVLSSIDGSNKYLYLFGAGEMKDVTLADFADGICLSSFKYSNNCKVTVPNTKDTVYLASSGKRDVNNNPYVYEPNGSVDIIIENPTCKILSDYDFFNYDNNLSVSIVGYPGSTAEEFCIRNSIEFKNIKYYNSDYNMGPHDGDIIEYNGIYFKYNERDTSLSIKDIKNYYSVVTTLSNETNVVIPDYIDDVPVVRIESNAFKNNTNLETLVLPKKLYSIDSNAFEDCTNLKNMNLSDCEIEIIGDSAFKNCSSLESIEINTDDIYAINTDAFTNCTSLNSVNINNGLVFLRVAFNNCPIKSFICHDSMYKVLDNNVIVYDQDDTSGTLLSIINSNLVEYTLPDGINKLDVDCINQKNLEKINVPYSTKQFNLIYGSFSIDIDEHRTVTKPNLEDKVITLEISNPDCEILFNGDEYEYDELSEHIIIKSSSNSKAKIFADKYGFRFISNDIAEEPTLYGDTNCDNKVSVSDAVLIMQSIANPDEYKITSQGVVNSDVIGNDGITSMDALAIQCVEAKIIKPEALPITVSELETYLEESGN